MSHISRSRLAARLPFILATVLLITHFARADVLEGLFDDAEVRQLDVGDGSPEMEPVVAREEGELYVGNVNSEDPILASAIYSFELPSVGNVENPFATATFTVGLVTSASTFSGNRGDVYGLAPRDYPDVEGDDAFAGELDETDATLIKNDWIDFNGSTPIPTGLKTLDDPALRDYLNAAYAGGANAGKYVLIRISADSGGPPFKQIRFASADFEGDATLRPRIEYSLVGAPSR